MLTTGVYIETVRVYNLGGTPSSTSRFKISIISETTSCVSKFDTLEAEKINSFAPDWWRRLFHCY